MVDSTMEAVDEIAARMPDLILLSALLSPRDEDALIAHLRSLDGASHLQTITIPQFRTGPAKAPEKKGGLFRKKSKAPAPIGCDPMAFAEEVVAHLKDACEIRNRPQAPKPSINVIAPSAPPPLIEDEAIASASAFDTTPFQSHYVAPEPEPFLSEPLMSGAGDAGGDLSPSRNRSRPRLHGRSDRSSKKCVPLHRRGRRSSNCHARPASPRDRSRSTRSIGSRASSVSI